jgi:Arc/MetJ-type ribon-helix-helix transcriptional regulator
MLKMKKKYQGVSLPTNLLHLIDAEIEARNFYNSRGEFIRASVRAELERLQRGGGGGRDD